MEPPPPTSPSENPTSAPDASAALIIAIIELSSRHCAARLDAGRNGSLREFFVSRRASWRGGGSCEVRHLATKNLVQGREQGDRSLIRNPVEDLLGLATRLDDAALTQLGELLRQAWLGEDRARARVAKRG